MPARDDTIPVVIVGGGTTAGHAQRVPYDDYFFTQSHRMARAKPKPGC